MNRTPSMKLRARNKGRKYNTGGDKQTNKQTKSK